MLRLARAGFMCAFLALLAACGPAIPPAGNYATITGTVTDASTGQPVAGASVAVSVLATTTDTSGRYTLYPVPTGPYGPVVVSAQNYQTYNSPEGTLAPGQVLTLQIQLTHT